MLSRQALFTEETCAATSEFRTYTSRLLPRIGYASCQQRSPTSDISCPATQEK
jgi:hypothetical protein